MGKARRGRERLGGALQGVVRRGKVLFLGRVFVFIEAGRVGALRGVSGPVGARLGKTGQGFFTKKPL